MAKAAAKETSLPVVVSLVFFVLLTIGLGVFVYVLYSDQEAKDAEVAKAKDEVKNLRAEAKEKELIARAHRVFAGVPEADDLSVLQAEVKEGDKIQQEIKKLHDAVKKKAPEVAKSQADRFNAVVKAYAADPNSAPLDPVKVGLVEADVWTGDVENGQLKAPGNKTALDLAARAVSQRNLAMNKASADQDATNQALAQMDAAAKAYKGASDLFALKTNSLPKEFKDKMDELEKALNDRTKKYSTDVAGNRQEIDKLTTQIDELNAKNRRLKEDIDRLAGERDSLLAKVKAPDPLRYEEPQGKILRTLPNDIVEIDLGSSALFTPGLTFEVEPMDYPEKGRQSRLREYREADDRGVMKTKVEFFPKASIEVIEVLGPALSRARITQQYDKIREAVLPGDLLYNVAWKRGVGEHVALLGVFDVNGDGTDDVEAVERDLRRMGINVDAVFDLRTGAWRGRLTNRTRYVVEGYHIPVSANDPHQAAKAALISKMGAAREEARTKAIQIVNFRDFFGRTGYRVAPNVPESRISQAVARYFAGVGTDPMPMVPQN
jgi:predicted nuclease with TOPRIM domain